MDDHINIPERIKLFTSFKTLGGELVPEEKVIDEIKGLPLNGILGFLSSLSIKCIQKGANFHIDEREQSDYLKLAIIDDFPHPLRLPHNWYAPGYVPFIKGSKTFIHEHNIAWLSHLALMNADEKQITENIQNDLKRRICRLLIIINDYLDKDFESLLDYSKTVSIKERRAIAAFLLRYSMFNRFQNDLEAWHQLARQKIIFKELLPNYYQTVEEEFLNATNGISLEEYYVILALWIAHIYFRMRFEKPFMRKSTFAKEIKVKREKIDHLLNKWTRKPEEYRKRVQEWKKSRIDKGDISTFDFVPLRETPLIEVREDELICPVIDFLLEKIIDEPFFAITDYLRSIGRDFNIFQIQLGKAYEDYAHNLIEILAKNDIKGDWHNKRNPKLKRGDELSDNYLQRGDIGICFEHKGNRLPTDFYLGSGDDRVLGPCDDVLELLSQGKKINPEDILREKERKENGLLTRGMWQQSVHAPELQKWAEKYIGNTPTKIFPIITYLAQLIIPDLCRKIYLENLIDQANLYNNNILEDPQWLHITELEALVALAEEGILDLELLLKEKSELVNLRKRFDVFLSDKQGGKILVNSYLKRKASEIINEAIKLFGKEK